MLRICLTSTIKIFCLFFVYRLNVYRTFCASFMDITSLRRYSIVAYYINCRSYFPLIGFRLEESIFFFVIIFNAFIVLCIVHFKYSFFARVSSFVLLSLLLFFSFFRNK